MKRCASRACSARERCPTIAACLAALRDGAEERAPASAVGASGAGATAGTAGGVTGRTTGAVERPTAPVRSATSTPAPSTASAHASIHARRSEGGLGTCPSCAAAVRSAVAIGPYGNGTAPRNTSRALRAYARHWAWCPPRRFVSALTAFVRSLIYLLAAA